MRRACPVRLPEDSIANVPRQVRSLRLSVMPNVCAPGSGLGFRRCATRRMARARHATVAASAVLLSACAPSMNWREVRADVPGAVMLFPCKPSSFSRMVRLGEEQVRMTLQACDAGGATWGLSWADVGDPARVPLALRALRQSAADNLAATPGDALPLRVPGATPQPDSLRQRLVGRTPDGKPVSGQIAVFSRGTVVFQATMLGGSAQEESATAFFTSVRLGG